MQRIRFIVEQHADGFIAYPLGVQGIVVGQGQSRAAALSDAQSALEFHVQTFGPAVLEQSHDVIAAFIDEAEVALV